MAKHTPAPWKLKDHGAIFGSNGEYIVDLGISPKYQNVRANARLIARSPSMLALLEKALPIIQAYAEQRDQEIADVGDNSWPNAMRELANEIESEIAKAKGESG